ncbi:hypothetical protein L873DRAFT_267889 [Choiromyces venosus 120613-1]|uniref:Uncharacterized protein n=1 Tax=Choiromyces venosus 120613-1 TaxID=1336337 RepID=A0A3N4J0X7_9PEZI|nr:hypothetical protein L873DRAFT_267889 [Choiromyces venosus 120613-1]
MTPKNRHSTLPLFPKLPKPSLPVLAFGGGWLVGDMTGHSVPRQRGDRVGARCNDQQNFRVQSQAEDPRETRQNSPCCTSSSPQGIPSLYHQR